MLYGVMIKLRPYREDEAPKIRLHSEVFATEEEAEAYIDEARRQNLPFDGKWTICFEDPRDKKGGD